MCALLPSGETQNYISAQKERSRLRDRSKQPEVAATQSMPTEVEGPPSSRLRTKTNKQKLSHNQDLQDPPERNTTMNLQNIAHKVHQLHIIETTRNKMQVVLPIVLIGILLLTNVFFYFRL